MKANTSENSTTKLTDEEMLAQMRLVACQSITSALPLTLTRTILLAGHETSATSLCWVLLELARHPAVQARLRTEIRYTGQGINAQGGSGFTAADLEGMPYLSAVLKVRGI